MWRVAAVVLSALDMKQAKNKLILLAGVLLIVPMVPIGCGETAKEGVVSVRATVTDVRPAADGQNVASIKIKIEDGKEIEVRIGEQINQTVWGMPHLQGHRQLGHRIGVKYQETPQGRVAVEFSE